MLLNDESIRSMGGFCKKAERRQNEVMLGFSRRVYLDHASATPPLPEALAAMREASRDFGNPGSIHGEGVAAKKRLEAARSAVARELGAKTRQIVFTSGLTESINLGILGLARRIELSGRDLEETHWITTSIEHSSVLECFADIERRGAEVTHLDPDSRGLIAPEELARAVRPNTVLISIGWANNEIGVVQDLAALARAAKAAQKSVLFHTDAGQGPLYLSPHVHTLGVDMMSLGSGKLYGPRSCGALYVQDHSSIAPVILGGGQEGGLRAGTEEVASPAGFACALEVISRERKGEAKRLGALRDELVKTLRARFPDVVVNGSLKHALPHMLNISIPGVGAEYLVLALDREGIALSTRSACNANAASSHVVQALADAAIASSSVALPRPSEAFRGSGAKEERSKNTLRISLGRDTVARDTARLQKALEALIPRLRSGDFAPSTAL